MKRIKYNRRFVNVGERKERGLAWKQLRSQSGVHGFACSSHAHAPSVIESHTRCLRLCFSPAVCPGAALLARSCWLRQEGPQQAGRVSSATARIYRPNAHGVVQLSIARGGGASQVVMHRGSRPPDLRSIASRPAIKHLTSTLTAQRIPMHACLPRIAWVSMFTTHGSCSSMTPTGRCSQHQGCGGCLGGLPGCSASAGRQCARYCSSRAADSTTTERPDHFT